MIKRIMLSALLVVTLSGLTACTNSVSPVEKSVTSLTTTTMVEATVTITPEQTTTKKPASVVTTTPKVTTTVKPTTVTTTTTKKVTTTPKLTTTTKKATTTTKKPTTVTTTTTKKVTTTTTTAKKTTTTAKKTTPKATTTKKPTTTTKLTTTKKQEITKPQQTIKITQSDVDKLVAELQEYSNSKAEYVTANWTEYRGYGKAYNTLDEFYAWLCEDKTPSNSSWSAPLSFNIYNDFYTYEYMLWYLKDAIDGEYNRNPDCHVVIYAEYFPNGFVWEGKQYTTYPCYTFWKLR